MGAFVFFREVSCYDATMVDELSRSAKQELLTGRAKKRIALSVAFFAVVLLFLFALLPGASNLNPIESWAALFGQGNDTAVRIVQQIRLPRVLAALIAGAGLAVSGLMMQTTLKNPMASPSTLGVSNAAAFGANVSIIVFAGGFLSTGHHAESFFSLSNPYSTGAMAFLFATLSTLLILGLCRLKAFSSEAVVLSGIALGAVWTAGTSLLQYFATDTGLAAAVVWSFGDLNRATFETDLIMLSIVLVGTVVFYVLRYRYNALAADETVARSLGVRVSALRFVSMLLASLITAIVVSCLGVIGFVGIIAPHAMRRLIGNDHRYLIPASILGGAALLLLGDMCSVWLGQGTVLPVGAITSLLGAPFFLYLIFAKKGGKA